MHGFSFSPASTCDEDVIAQLGAPGIYHQVIELCSAVEGPPDVPKTGLGINAITAAASPSNRATK